jgi:RNA polymerase sigma-70 factor (ECF subfamily)
MEPTDSNPDPDIFADLVTRHDARLRSLALRFLHDPVRVDDALQEVYLKAFRRLPTFRADASLGTWLYRITANVCLDELRRRRIVGDGGDVDVPSADPGPAERAVAKRHAAEVLSALAPDLRATVMLVYGYGYGYAEAARALGVPPGTIGSRLHRARQEVVSRAA